MPISLKTPTRRIAQSEFGKIAFDVMAHTFSIHNEFGRFFDEKIYKRELAGRMAGIALESPITVSYDTFSKTYYMDILVDSSGLFEFKSAEAIHARHRGQTINYLLLADLAHAKIINVRPEKIEHEFVNCSLRLSELRNPSFIDDDWDDGVPGAKRFRELLIAITSDWGAGLELLLYEEALSHFLFGEEDIAVFGTPGELGQQRTRLAASGIAFKLTALSERHGMFAIHAQRLIEHTSLEAILWANVTHREITFSTIRRSEWQKNVW